MTNYAWYQSDFFYSTLDYSSTSPQNPRMEMRTIYKQFLGSALWINLPKPLSSILGSNDLLIPTYCPVISTNISSSTTNSYYQPIINIVFGNSTGFAMTSINQHWAPYKAGLNSSYLYFTMTNSQIAKTLLSTMNDSRVYTTLRFNSYNLLGGADNIINIYPGARNQMIPSDYSLGQSWTCTGFIILLTSPLTIDNTVSPLFTINGTTVPSFIWPSSTGYSQKIINYSTFTMTVPALKSFYAFGKKFNIAVLSTSKTGITMKNPGSTTTFQGIKRPTIESFISQSNGVSYLDSVDKLAFYCQNSGSSGSGDLAYFTNYNANIP